MVTVTNASLSSHNLHSRVSPLQGAISFPIFVLHGPIGQVFYKKIVATKLWGSVMPLSFFPAYCGVVLLAAALVQKFFVVRLCSAVGVDIRLRSIYYGHCGWAIDRQAHVKA